MAFIAYAKFTKESSNAVLEVLTGSDTWTNYKYVDATLPAGTGTGQLDNAANLLDATAKENVWNNAMVFDIGTDYDGKDVATARSYEARLQGQFNTLDIRPVTITVSQVPTNNAYI